MGFKCKGRIERGGIGDQDAGNDGDAAISADDNPVVIAESDIKEEEKVSSVNVEIVDHGTFRGPKDGAIGIKDCKYTMSAGGKYICGYTDSDGHKCKSKLGRKVDFVMHYLVDLAGPKAFVCKYQGCGRKFSRKREMKRHLKDHSGENLYKCKYCGQCFGSDSKARWRHYQSAHSD